jgi:hypothetical protein
MFYFYFFAMSQFDWPIIKKKKTTDTPQNRRFYRIPSLLPTYMGQRRTTFAKAYGIKVRCYGDHVGEHNGNLGNPL